MKKLILLFIGVHTLSYGQITLNKDHFPAAGDVFLMSRASSNTIDFATTGEDMHWDFSDLEYVGTNTREYGSTGNLDFSIQILFGQYANVKYKATYYTPATEIAFNNLPAQLPIQISDVNQFHKIATDSMTAVGLMMKINGNTVPIKNDTIETLYHFPVEYGNAHTSSSYIDFDMNPIYNARWKQLKYRETEVDGWGQVITPQGTYDVLRIHHKIRETDSLYVSVMGFSRWVRIPVPVRHEYEWRAREEKEPVVLIKTTETGNTEQVTSVEYRDDSHLSAQLLHLSARVFPNPAEDILYIESSSAITSYALYSTDGKLVGHEKVNSALQYHISTAVLQPGNYLLKLFSENGVSTQKITKL